MVTHPAPGHRTGTLANAVAGYCADDAEGMESGRPGIVHRLDRFTSGCIIVARDSEARRSLQKQFADRTVSKLYLAVVARPPPETDADEDELVIDEPIGRHPIHRERMAVVEGGRRPCRNQFLRRVRPPRHRRDACSMAWRCRFITARRSQHGRVHPTHWLICAQVGALYPGCACSRRMGGGASSRSRSRRAARTRSASI